MNTSDFREGQEAAWNVLQSLKTCGSPPDRRDQLADAIGELIDVSLGWDNLRPTRDRLLGFSEVLTHALQAQPAVKLQPVPRQCCTAWRRAFLRLKTMAAQI